MFDVNIEMASCFTEFSVCYLLLIDFIVQKM